MLAAFTSIGSSDSSNSTSSSSTTEAIPIPFKVIANPGTQVPAIFLVALTEQVQRMDGKLVELVQVAASNDVSGDYVLAIQSLGENEPIPTLITNIRPTLYIRQKADVNPGSLRITEDGMCIRLCEIHKRQQNDPAPEQYNMSAIVEHLRFILKNYFNVLNKLKLDAAMQVYISQTGKGQEEYLHDALSTRTGIRFINYKQVFKANHVRNISSLLSIFQTTPTEQAFNIILICRGSFSTDVELVQLLTCLDSNKEHIVSRKILLARDSSPLSTEAGEVMTQILSRYNNLVVELGMPINISNYNTRFVNEKIQIFVMHYKDRIHSFFINESLSAGHNDIFDLLKVNDNLNEAERTVNKIKIDYLTNDLSNATL